MNNDKGMLRNLLIVLGGIIILIDLICPFPALLGVPGLVWRLIIGILSCALIFACVVKSVKEKVSKR